MSISGINLELLGQVISSPLPARQLVNQLTDALEAMQRGSGAAVPQDSVELSAEALVGDEALARPE